MRVRRFSGKGVLAEPVVCLLSLWILVQRSNREDVRVTALSGEKTGRCPIPFASYAIDFVPIGQLNERLAVDFKVAPGTRGTGVDGGIIPSKETLQKTLLSRTWRGHCVTFKVTQFLVLEVGIMTIWMKLKICCVDFTLLKKVYKVA